MYIEKRPIIPPRAFHGYSCRAVLMATAYSVADYMHPKCQQAWLRRLKTPLPKQENQP